VLRKFFSKKYDKKKCTLTLWRPAAFGDFRKKNAETHVALRGNFSGPVCSTDPVKV